MIRSLKNPMSMSMMANGQRSLGQYQLTAAAIR
jgi:hypothetical protein